MFQTKASQTGVKTLLWLVPPITFGLGIWQIKRLYWKLDLIEKMNQGNMNESKPLSLFLNDFTKQHQYTRVHAKGTFLFEKEMFLGPRLLKQDMDAANGGVISQRKPLGYYVITPFQTSDSNQVILVNRGWIPLESKQELKSVNEEETVEIEGIIRMGESKPWMSSIQNEPEKEKWIFLDVNEMSKSAGSESKLLELVSGKTLEIHVLDSQINQRLWKKGMPLPGSCSIQLPNNHLSYAITW